MNHKSTSLFFVLVSLLFVINGCKETLEESTETTVTNSYLPTKPEYQWGYEVKTTTYPDSNVSITYPTAMYNIEKERLEFFLDDKLEYYFSWYHENNKLVEDGIILFDYLELDCNSDSVLIESYITNGDKFNTYQYCQAITYGTIDGRRNVSGTKTLTTGDLTDLSFTRTENVFGLNLGLVSRVESEFNSAGELTKKMETTLKTHNL